MRRLLAAGERDGLTVRRMAERAGMPAGTLAWWRSEIRRRDAVRRRTLGPPLFVEVVAPSPAVESAAAESRTTEAPAAAATAADAAQPFEGSCGAAVTAPLPPSVPRGSFGPRLQALVVEATGVFRLSRRETAALCKDAFGVDIAVGSVAAIERRMARLGASALGRRIRSASDRAAGYTLGSSLPRAVESIRSVSPNIR